jgi:DNA-binding NtrC family response regulator
VPFNFESKCIETAEELQQELDSNPPDIILSDFTLPQFDGLQALRILQKRKLDIPFILVTGTRSEEVAVDCIKEGADDYILKASLMRLRSSIDNTLLKKATER